MNSSDIAIRVDGLGKRYRIGSEQTGGSYRYKSLRDSLSGLARQPIQAARDLVTRQSIDQRNSFWALDNVSFDVKRGEVIGIIGRNGAGKSTLLKVLSRITKPTKGRIELRGRVGSLLEVGTGFHPELTGRENIFLNGAVLGMTRAEVKSKFDEIVDFSEIEKFLDTPVKHYSSGMYMRLAFAVAANLEPEILVVDEVLAVGDAEFQRKCLGKMQSVANGGRTILFVSHNLAAIRHLCTSALVLASGRLHCIGSVDEATASYQNSAAAITQNDLTRAYRTGSGAVKFTAFWIENDQGQRVERALSGDTISLVFTYETAGGSRVRNVNVGFGLHPPTGERLAVLYASDLNQEFRILEGAGTIRCTIPRLPFSATLLTVIPRFEVDGVEADFPRDGVGTLHVEDGDFFGTGRTIGSRGTAPFLLAGQWHAASQQH